MSGSDKPSPLQAEFYNKLMAGFPFLPDFRKALAHQGIDDRTAGLVGGLIHAAYVAGTATGFRTFGDKAELTQAAGRWAEDLKGELDTRVARFVAKGPGGLTP